ncbi:MAG: hypothetical protein PHF50_03910 [Patescibacteria group bacterium]|nr:hypothetical protein [Patescibacteria group bacterium]
MTFLNLLFLLIGLFLAVGATIVFATWNDAKTGDSGSLSETNWNALVDMLEASGGGCVKADCSCRWASSSSGSCTCTPPDCPSGFTNQGASDMIETSYFNTNTGLNGGTMGSSRYCCK